MSTATLDKPRPARRPRLEEREPRIKDMVSTAIRTTGSIAQAAATLGLNVDTVGDMLRRNPDDFAPIKRHLASRYALGAEVAVERVLTEGRTCRPGDLTQLSIAGKVNGQAMLEQLGEAGAPMIQVNIVQAAMQDGETLARRLAELLDSKLHNPPQAIAVESQVIESKPVEVADSAAITSQVASST